MAPHPACPSVRSNCCRTGFDIMLHSSHVRAACFAFIDLPAYPSRLHQDSCQINCAGTNMYVPTRTVRAAGSTRFSPSQQQNSGRIGAQFSRSAGDVTASRFNLTSTLPATGVVTVPVEQPAFLRNASTLERSNSGSRPSYVSGTSQDGGVWIAGAPSGPGVVADANAQALPESAAGVMAMPSAGYAPTSRF